MLAASHGQKKRDASLVWHFLCFIEKVDLEIVGISRTGFNPLLLKLRDDYLRKRINVLQ